MSTALRYGDPSSDPCKGENYSDLKGVISILNLILEILSLSSIVAYITAHKSKHRTSIILLKTLKIHRDCCV